MFQKLLRHRRKRTSNTVPRFFESFGSPDVCLCLEADGDVVAYDSYYEASRKWVRWMASVSQPTVVMYGGDAETFRIGEASGVRRTGALAGFGIDGL